MVVIGLTGGIATGKSTVAEIIKQFGIDVISSDDLVHHLMKQGQPVYQQIILEFGEKIIDKSGNIDRKLLGEIVFADAELRRKLEAIVHPAVIQDIQRKIEAHRLIGTKLFVIEVPLLFEAGLKKMFDLIWVVSTTREQQMGRLQERNHLTELEAENRISAQLPLKLKEEKADAVIFNQQDTEYLKRRLKELLMNLGVEPCKTDLK